MPSCVYLIATDSTTNWKMDIIVPSKKVGAADTPTGSCSKRARLPFVDPFKSSFVTDATTNLSMAEDLSSKDKAQLFGTDATTNLNVAEDSSRLICFVE